jgi:DNA processing protein
MTGEKPGVEKAAAENLKLHQDRKKSDGALPWLYLMQVPTLGATLMRRLISRFGDPESLFSQSMATLRAAGVEDSLARTLLEFPGGLLVGGQRILESALCWLESDNNHLVTMVDERYPALLGQISDYPPLLFVTGDPAMLNRPMIAIVGSRNSTVYGRETAYRLSVELAEKGFVICSGLASGIDTEAHKATVCANSPTVAVLGNGLFDIYPPRNRALAQSIVYPLGGCCGALVSELPLDAGPLPSHFPSRNRIISGLSLGVCVVEANLRSGSLITARLALEQNREVFAVPGSVNSARSRGCHQLLRQGAVLVENADDIVVQIESLYRGQLDLMKGQLQLRQAELPTIIGSKSTASLLPDAEGLLTLIGDDPMSTDALVQRSGLSVSEISSVLLALELDGHVFQTSGCWQRIKRR